MNKALEGLQRVRRCSRFTEPRESRVAVQQYQASNDSIAAWLDEHTIDSLEATVPQSELHAAYASYCQQQCRRPTTKQRFGHLLRALRPETEPAQRIVTGRRIWVYKGIALRGAADWPKDIH
jgi:phage/plasmid-associated DNA primase